MNRTNLKGWKRLAAGLIVLPGLTGVGFQALGQIARAQEETKPSSNTATTAPTGSARVEQARLLMVRAEAALSAKDYPRAAELAEQAKAMKVSGAFYDSTPDALLEKIRKASGGKVGGTSTPTSTAKGTPAVSTDPKVLVTGGRAALDKGDLEKAQDLARQAEALRPSSRWGIFDDTPASLLKDVQKAQARRDRDTSDKMLTQARALLQKSETDPAARAANLEKAQTLAMQAERLHGPYSMWDMGDRPTKLVAEIDTARVKSRGMAMNRKPGTTLTPTTTSAKTEIVSAGTGSSKQPPIVPNGPGAGQNAIRTVSNSEPAKADVKMLPLPVSADGKTKMPEIKDIVVDIQTGGSGEPAIAMAPPSVPATQATPMPVTMPPSLESVNKPQAVALMKEAAALRKSGNWTAAAEKYRAASALGVSFAPGETNPDDEILAVQGEATRKMTAMCNEATEASMKKTPEGYAKAEGLLAKAEELGKGLGLDLHMVQQHRLAMTALKVEGSASAAPAASIQVALDPMPAPAPMPTGAVPVMPIDVAPPKVEVAVTLPKVEVAPIAPMGVDLIAQARQELRRGETDTANKMVVEAMAAPTATQAIKTEGEALLRQIQAEEYAQRQASARRSYDNAIVSYNNSDYRNALSVFVQIDPSLLAEEKRASLRDMIERSTAAAKKASDARAVASNPMSPMGSGLVQAQGTGEGGVINSGAPKPGAEGLVKEQEALVDVRFQQMRVAGMKLQTDAVARFGRGETDEALSDLQAYTVKVREAGFDATRTTLLLRSVEQKIAQLSMLKHQKDVLTGEKKDKDDFRREMTQETLLRDRKKKDVAELMKKFNALMDDRKFEEAEKVAMMAKELDPDDVGVTAAAQVSRVNKREKNFKDIKGRNEERFYEGINEAIDGGVYVGDKQPLKFDADMFRQNSANRQNFMRGIQTNRSYSEREIEIQRTLKKATTISFNGQTLKEVLDHVAATQGINITVDVPGEEASMKTPITEKLNNVPLDSVLSILLRKVNLAYVVENDVLRITTLKLARGRSKLVTLPVQDLVIPIQNYESAPTSSMDTMLARHLQTQGAFFGSGPTPYTPNHGLSGNGATAVGSNSSSMSTTGGGRINNQPVSVSVASSSATKEDVLMKLITSSIKPDTWSGTTGGTGTIEYFPITQALVINQTPDVIEEVVRLLESLRRLADLEVAIEMRMITLSETFFERIGVDFSLNIKSNSSDKIQPQLTTGNFRTFPFINGLAGSGVGGVVTGLTPAGTLTPDLAVPIRSTSYQYAIPSFGGYPNQPGSNGGLSLGLAFLNDIQVYMFMEAAQGDRRTNVMQAPKLTMFSGQSANLTVQDQQFFVTGVTVASVNGQIVYVPQNNPFPFGVNLQLQPVVSADRRFVRLNINQQVTGQQNPRESALVPQFPITTFITPVFEGGFQGQPVPFTQFIQQPTFTQISLQTTVAVPDGGTVLIGGLKTMREGRNEFGPPVLSKVPYINRLFKNVGYGREAESLMIMVTPRIIINSEEQERQTGVVDGAGGDGNQ